MKTPRTSFHTTVSAVILFPAMTILPGMAAPAQPMAMEVSEGFTNPFGFYDAKPTFSWKLPVGTAKQGAYHIIVRDDAAGKDLWDSGKVESDQSVWVRFGGEPLASRQAVSWKVKFWDGKGAESAWSEDAKIEMGLLGNNDWSAKWITAPETIPTNIPAHPGYHFRKDFSLAKKLVKARLYASALGIYEFRINGKQVGDDIMAPGWTSYDNRVETKTYDVTEMLHKGDNAIGALLGEGWYAGTLFRRNIDTLKGRMPKLLGQLELTFADGSSETIVTDGSWKATDKGPITASGYYYGEEYDARMDLGKWTEAGYDDTAWKPASATAPEAKPLLEPKPMAPVRVTQNVAAISVKEQSPGVFIFDFGQNLVGFPELNIPVKKDGKIAIRVAEMLNQDGTMYTENYREARSLANYIPAADGEIRWQPSLTFFGFRYVELSGLPEGTKLGKEAVVAKVIHTDFKSIGTFTSSHEKLNQLQSNIRWGQIGNFVDVPTDCPQRDERLGWTGDAQVILPSSFFNYDLYAFWSRWLKIARDDQMPNGAIPFFIPKAEVQLNGFCPGWGDAIVTIPWEIYERTGDKRILEDNFEAMKKWIKVYDRDAKGHISSIKGFGDWLQPFTENQRGDTPFEVIATAYYGRCARILAWTAEAIGETEDAARFQKLHADIRSAFSKKFIAADGTMEAADTQTAYLMALGYDLVEPASRTGMEAGLIAALEKADRHLRTGFLGTPLLAPTFDEIGHPEISYELLFKETYPGWFFSINQGATTMWERWNSYSHEDGFGKASMNSFNHYAYGAIGQWMYERVAGLAPDPAHPGYKHFFIRPLPGGPLSSASAELETPYGLAKSAWKTEGETMTMDAIIPPNTTATIVFPTKDKDSVKMNGKALPDAQMIDEQVSVKLSAGKYQFELTKR